MNIINYHKLKIFWAVTFGAIFITGCVQPVILFQIENRSRDFYQEFTGNDYTVGIKLKRTGKNHNYLLSLRLVKNSDGIPVRNIKSALCVYKYPEGSMKFDRHRHGRRAVYRSIEPIIDTLSHDFNYRYEIKSRGKYELSINLTEINGMELDQEIKISLNQDVRLE